MSASGQCQECETCLRRLSELEAEVARLVREVRSWHIAGRDQFDRAEAAEAKLLPASRTPNGWRWT